MLIMINIIPISIATVAFIRGPPGALIIRERPGKKNAAMPTSVMAIPIIRNIVFRR